MKHEYFFSYWAYIDGSWVPGHYAFDLPVQLHIKDIDAVLLGINMHIEDQGYKAEEIIISGWFYLGTIKSKRELGVLRGI